MDGDGRAASGGAPVEIPLKAKYRNPGPKGRFRADYMGNTGVHRPKHFGHPAIHGIRRKRLKGAR